MKIGYLCDGTDPNCSDSPWCINQGPGYCERTQDPKFAKHKDVVKLDPKEHPDIFEEIDTDFYFER